MWFRSSRIGDDRDRVLVKSNGDATYLAGDLAYHRDKFLVRGFERVIDIFGADHAGQVKSLMLGVEAMGVELGRLEIKLGQMVSLVSAGRMSKRAGNFVSLDSLIDDIGPDATRLLSLMSSLDQATLLDLDLVRSQSMENPVYLRAVCPRPHRLDRARAGRAGHRAPSSRRRRPVAAGARARAGGAAPPRGTARRRVPTRGVTGLLTR